MSTTTKAPSLEELTRSLLSYPEKQKQAAHPEDAVDPNEKGTVSKEEHSTGADTKDNQGKETPATQDTSPPVGKDTAQVEEGDVGVPQMASSAKEGSMNGIAEKLATFFSEEEKAENKSAQNSDNNTSGNGEKSAAPTKEEEKVASENMPRYHLLKVAEHLMESAQGRRLVFDALDEVTGQETARDLVKRACAEQADFEKNWFKEQVARAEQQKQAAYREQVQQELDTAYQDLMKEASEADHETVDQSANQIKRAATLYADNPAAYQAFNLGVKAAAAMQQGGEEAMAQSMGGAGGETPSIEEIAMVLELLLQEGAIEQQEAQQILQQYAAEMQGAGGAPQGKAASVSQEQANREMQILDIVGSNFDS